MAVYIGVDLHVRTQTVCWMNTADGEIHQHTLDHSRDDVRAFYAQFAAPAVVGIESSGYALWFHQLIEQAGHRLLVGDAYAIRQFARRRQKNDRRDAELLLDLLRREEFPVVHRPAPPSQDTLALLRYRHRLVRMRTMVKNGLQAVALNHQLRLGFRLFTVRGQQRFAALPLSGAYATQRQQSQVLLTTLEAQIAAVNQELATRAWCGCVPIPAWACRPRWPWCTRSSRSPASTALAASPPTAGWTPASIPAATPRATATSPSRATACCDSCWWKPPGVPCNTKKTWDGSSAACGRGRSPMQ